MQTRYRPPPADALPHRSHLYSLEEVANKDPGCGKRVWQCMLVLKSWALPVINASLWAQMRVGSRQQQQKAKG